MQLAATDIDGVDAERTTRKQDLGESARRGANIEADAPRRIELEMVQGRGELYAAARHPWMLRLRNERRILENFLGRPAHNHIVCAHPPRRNRRLRLGP